MITATFSHLQLAQLPRAVAAEWFDEVTQCTELLGYKTSDEIALQERFANIVVAALVLVVSPQRALQTIWICVRTYWHNSVQPTWSKTLRSTAF